MAWFAATRLTLTKSQAEEKPILEQDDPFPESSYYTEADMKRLEAEGLVYSKAKDAAKAARAPRAVKAVKAPRSPKIVIDPPKPVKEPAGDEAVTPVI